MNDLPPKTDNTCEHKSVPPCTLCSLSAYLTKYPNIEWTLPEQNKNRGRYARYTNTNPRKDSHNP